MIEPDLIQSVNVHSILPILPASPRPARRPFRRKPAPERRTITDRRGRYRLDYLSASERDWLEQDLERAAQVQRHLLPDTNMHFEGWDISYRYQAFGPLGGDYCDILPGEDGEKELLLALGDASGKGIAASLLMAQLHAIFRTLGSTHLTVQELVERANQILCQHSVSRSFATLVCVRATSEGEVEIGNAGHCSPLLVGPAGVTRIEAGGLPLGMFPNAHCEVTRKRLAKGESLFLYTDGLTEARNASDSEYGAERLLEKVEEGSALPPQAMIETCMESVAAFRADAPSTDDVTVMAMRYA
jgi:sigma-B regulation protein RsbU (phosphoserine phosphatase)